MACMHISTGKDVILLGIYGLGICISYAPFIGISVALVCNLTFVGENEIYNINVYSIV